MTKEILLSIAGLHLADGEDGNIEVVTAGDYYNRGGKHYILYDEVTEGMDGHTSNVIKIGENSLEITKKGLMNTRLVVEKGKSHRTVYQTPFGDIELSLTGQELTVTETEERIDIRAEYVLAVNEENLSECTIEMNIRPREAGNLNLQG
ncbi:rho guanine nucleotide exchange factor [Lachnoclostridium sp. An131]|uniref:DUF1934 domain-containing protein n=1 Tax=Lachnoclostridium sp. An131 TaxID=1965555 RepID=UPI000B377C70|nr:DUF1934 domain-containing protein [Lachnoclostridium sp. An131]OUQ28513.1 rho guanine nucleotide exchange factor [Lachnoclostridium sp. An131]